MPQPNDLETDDLRDGHDEAVLAGTPVVVRRNAGLAALIGAGASAIAIAYLWRATQTGALVDAGLCLVMALIAGFYLSGLVDARTPLLVADDLGVRIRLGNQWRGLPWEAVRQVVVEPRRGLLRDGRLVFSPHSLGRALDGLDTRGRRSAALNQKMYGAALAVPVGLTTRVSRAEGDPSLADQLAALAHGRADVVVVEPEPAREAEGAPERAEATTAVAAEPLAPLASPAPPAAEPVEEPVALVEPVTEDAEATPASARGWLTRSLEAWRAARPEAAERTALAGEPGDAPGNVPGFADWDDEADDEDETTVDDTVEDEDGAPRGPRRSLVGGIGTIVSRVAKGRAHDVDGSGEEAAATAPAASAVPLRETRRALRSEVTRDAPATTLGATALRDEAQQRRTSLPEGRELHRPGSVDLFVEPVQDSRVRPISTFGDAVEPLVIDDFVTEPAYDPVIGPELAAARTRLGLSVDELADRTRIRPHVIESIEVDDFAPCGGDFYARGHLRTLARVLGKDVTPLLEQFDARYATAPINARRVFEAELATGMTGSMRSTVGGPNWGLLVGTVLVLVLVWGVVRLFATQPPQQVELPAPALNGSAGIGRSYPDSAPAQAAARPVRVTLTASGDAKVVVRDTKKKVVFAGPLVPGERKTVEAAPPVTVHASDAGAVTVMVGHKHRGPVGEAGKPGTRTLHR